MLSAARYPSGCLAAKSDVVLEMGFRVILDGVRLSAHCRLKGQIVTEKKMLYNGLAVKKGIYHER